MKGSYMDEERRKPTYTTTDRGAGHGTSVVAWIALLLALLALGLAWWAFNRTGEDLTNRIQEQVQQVTPNVQQGAEEVQEGAQQGADAVQEGANQTEDAIDAGPDGVDEDDTETQTSPNTTQ